MARKKHAITIYVGPEIYNEIKALAQQWQMPSLSLTGRELILRALQVENRTKTVSERLDELEHRVTKLEQLVQAYIEGKERKVAEAEG